MFDMLQLVGEVGETPLLKDARTSVSQFYARWSIPMLDDKLKLVGHSGCGRVLSLAEESPHPKVVGYNR